MTQIRNEPTFSELMDEDDGEKLMEKIAFVIRNTLDTLNVAQRNGGIIVVGQGGTLVTILTVSNVAPFCGVKTDADLERLRTITHRLVDTMFTLREKEGLWIPPTGE